MKITVFIILLCSAKILCSQPYYFKHYQVENGLSNNSVFASVQDDKGFMWFGTKDGLNRFDGYSFKTYRRDPSNPTSLGNDIINTLASDKTAGLWIGTELGLYKYEPKNETFTVIKETIQMPIGSIHIDKKGTLWLISDRKVYKYNTKKKLFSSIKVDNSFNVGALYCRSNGDVLITSADGIIAAYDADKNSFKSLYQIKSNSSEPLGWISVFTETHDHQLLIGTNNMGIMLFNPKTKVLKNIISLNKDKTRIFVRAIQALNDHEYWIGTESGLYIYNHLTGNISNLQKQFSNPYALSDNAIYTLCKDNENGIWMGTYFGGINYYTASLSIFTKYFPEQQNSISGNDIREICKDKNGNFWIGTEDAGLNKLDPKTGRFTNYSPTGNKYSIAHSNIHGLVADDDKLWIGTFEHGLDVMDINTGLITKNYRAGKGNALRSSFILSILRTKLGEILVASTVGIYKYNRKKDDFDAIPGLPYYFFNNILEDSEGYIWAGTYKDGLFRFKLGDTQYTNFRNEPTDKNTLGNNIINGIFEDSRKNIWVVTDGGGLSLLDKKNSTFKNYTTNNGLPSNFLCRIQEDHDYKLWISSTQGLICFDPENEKVKIYTKADGLLTDQFNYNSSFKDKDGRLYFGSVRGMISFLPKQLTSTSKSTPIFLTSFQTDNTKNQYKNDKSILYTDAIILDHNQSSFSMDFAGLSYISPEMTEYAYKMDGLFNNWEYLKTNRKVYFTKLAPGSYIFHAKAKIRGSNEWSKDSIRLSIIIRSPWWQTSMAYFIYAILLLALVTVLILQYHKRTELKNRRKMKLFEHEKEKEIYQAKIEFFNNIAHEIRTPLTLIRGPVDKLIKYSKEVPHIEKNLKVMSRNTDRLLNLVNQLLDFRKTEVKGYSLNFVKVNISELVEDIAIQFQYAVESRHINLEVNLPSEELNAYVDAEALYKIMSNMVDNAIKYSKSEVRISLIVNQVQEKFSFQVYNDGHKIPAELKEKIFEPFFRAKETEIQQGTGIGLSISKSLVELHDGQFYLDESGADCNIFIAEFPIHQAMGFNLEEKWKKM